MSDGMRLWSNDPEPPVGTTVRDSLGRKWWRSSGSAVSYWVSAESMDPESWVKIAGNYGPVEVVYP